MLSRPRFSSGRLAVLGVLAALSLAVHTLESVFPPLFGIPGAKLGLANLFSMLALVLYGPLDAALILLARTLFALSSRGMLLRFSFPFREVAFHFCLPSFSCGFLSPA